MAFSPPGVSITDTHTSFGSRISGGGIPHYSPARHGLDPDGTNHQWVFEDCPKSPDLRELSADRSPVPGAPK